MRLAVLLFAVGCAATADTVLIARLDDPDGLSAIRARFRASNPGYDVRFQGAATRLAASDRPRVAFVQRGPARAHGPDLSSVVDVGDIVLLRPGEEMRFDAGVDLLLFDVPDAFPDDLPTFIRPDWDPLLTDTPGGCATETGAYRRILLTWLKQNGPYTYHALNAHRVRITDSFSHYHPVDGGFDEFYLVQMVQPDGRIVVSGETALIERPEDVTPAQAGALLEAHPLEVGDLVYIPRGVVHRGVGGVLAQVITTPGFKPGAEIGVDHHLRAINERLGLEGPAALPFHFAGSLEPIIR